MGHTHPSGNDSNGVPGGMSPIGSPFSGSYTYPQFEQMYFFTAYGLPCGPFPESANLFPLRRPRAASGQGPLARGVVPRSYARDLRPLAAGSTRRNLHLAPQAAPGNPPHRPGAPRLSGEFSLPVPPGISRSPSGPPRRASAGILPALPPYSVGARFGARILGSLPHRKDSRSLRRAPPCLPSVICPHTCIKPFASTRRNISPGGGARRSPRWSVRAPSPSSR